MVRPQPRASLLLQLSPGTKHQTVLSLQGTVPSQADGEGPLTCLDEESPESLPALLHGMLAVCLLGGSSVGWCKGES